VPLTGGAVLPQGRAQPSRQETAAPHERADSCRAATASRRAATCQPRRGGWSGSDAGAVSTRNCSSAATIAAASESDDVVDSTSIRGLGGRRFPFLATGGNISAVAPVAAFDSDAVLAAVRPGEAIERVREAFLRHHRGEWAMPPKVYVDAPPHGDFRAMPARGGGLATLKWVTSFPRNLERGLPAVAGALLASDSDTGQLVAILDCAAVTSLRTGAAAAVSAQALARPEARSVGIVGCGVNGAWAARLLGAAGYGPGVCFDPRPEAARSLADELGWAVGTRADAVGQEVVVTVAPGAEPVVVAGDLRSGQHVAALGADAAGKAEVELEALDRCHLFCDDWEQAKGGGELSHAVATGRVARGQVTELGAVLSGDAPGREEEAEVTLFDSTGLAIQDLAIAAAVIAAWREGRIAESATLAL
jgi:alanine dehydrogenase